MRKPEDYESEIKALKAEIGRLRGGAAAMTMAGARPVAAGPSFTLSGLEEMILVVGPRGEVTYWNDRMARLLGLEPDQRRSLIGKQLTEAVHGPAADAIIAMVMAARDSAQPFEVEREIPELQGTMPEWQKRPPLLRFSCAAASDKIQVVAQDVTHVRWVEKNFSRYVSQHVISQMGEMSEEELLRTRRVEATVLFGDLRGFTRACQQLTPEGVVEMVNTFMSVAVEAIEHFDGMVDKFVGDEVMAVFGVPLPQPNHALRALLAADRIIKGHARWQKDRLAAGIIAPAVGLGIATGEMIVGNIGTQQRMDYTVLGHNVNLGARLCGKAGEGEIFTVRETHQAARDAVPGWTGGPVPHFHFTPRGMVELKNVFKPVEIIAVTAD